MCKKGGRGWGYVESTYRSNTLRIWPDSEPAKLHYHPQTLNLGGKGATERAAKYLCWSIFKKSRHLGFGVFIDIWSMLHLLFLSLAQKQKGYAHKSPPYCSQCFVCKYTGYKGWRLHKLNKVAWHISKDKVEERFVTHAILEKQLSSALQAWCLKTWKNNYSYIWKS